MALRWFFGVLGTEMAEQCFPISGGAGKKKKKKRGMGDWCRSGFQMPLHYPRYKKEDYEKMEEWKVDMLLKEYGLDCEGSLQEKRAYAIGAFLWPDQL